MLRNNHEAIFLLVIFCLCSIVNVIAWNSSIGRDKAWQIVKRQILDGDSTKNICVWQSDTIVAAASPIHTMFDGFKTSPNYDAWLFLLMTSHLKVGSISVALLLLMYYKVIVR